MKEIKIGFTLRGLQREIVCMQVLHILMFLVLSQRLLIYTSLPFLLSKLEPSVSINTIHHENIPKLIFIGTSLLY